MVYFRLEFQILHYLFHGNQRKYLKQLASYTVQNKKKINPFMLNHVQPLYQLEIHAKVKNCATPSRWIRVTAAIKEILYGCVQRSTSLRLSSQVVLYCINQKYHNRLSVTGPNSDPAIGFNSCEILYIFNFSKLKYFHQIKEKTIIA